MSLSSSPFILSSATRACTATAILLSLLLALAANRAGAAAVDTTVVVADTTAATVITSTADAIASTADAIASTANAIASTSTAQFL
ncbi:PREDICTED: uncharacterized protein LOC107170858 [Diuraphis noxia]|uniref:uncharacterized protein LOC107170858 n=1 Tax=Diuraphis noxia TaxID=143948 RepID=UPI0007638F75|nr:PREDICTED: uncharacterized protein LOC107170858 [Diuraphis noxia]